MARDVFAGENSAVAVADDDGRCESLVCQESSGDLIVFDAFGYGLISAADRLAAVVRAYRVSPRRLKAKKA